MMTNCFRLTWNTLTAALLLIGAVNAFAQESATPEAAAPMLAGSVYRASDIEAIRALAAQVNWKEGTIDEAVQEGADEFDAAWTASLKAAVLGKTERLQNALQSFDAVLNDESVDQPRPIQVARLIESFDLLQATFEWKALPQDNREAFEARVNKYLDEVFDRADSITIQSSFIAYELREMASWKALQSYWGALAQNEKWFQKGLTYELVGLNDSLVNHVKSHITSEGFFGQSAGEHTTTASICLAAGAALRSASPDAYIELKPYLQAMLNAATELTLPNGEWPVFMNKERPGVMQNAELFERGYRLFGDQRSALLLDRIYKNSPRSVEHAVIGGPTLFSAIDHSLSSTLLPQTGAALLRGKNSPLSVLLDTGASRFGEQAGLLSLSVLHTDKQWTNDNAGLSGVVIDGAQQTQPLKDDGLIADPKNALVMNMRETPDGDVYVSSTAAGQFTERPAYRDEQVAGFKQGTYQRALYLSGNLLIDLFWVRGGSQQDYSYRVNGAWQAGDAPNAFVATQADTTERLWSVNPDGLQLSAGSDDDPGLMKAHYVGEGNLFAFAHEFIEGERQPTAVKLLPLDPAPNARDFQAIAFAIERGQRTDLFFAALSREIEYKGKYKDIPFTFQGDFGHMRFEGPDLESLFLTGGSTLEYDQYGIALNHAMQYGGLNAIAPGETLARTIMDESIPVHGLYSILALDMDAPTVMYQPFWAKAAGYEYEPNQPQRLQLLQPGLVDNQAASLGVSLRPGCKTVFHHTVHMKRYSHKNRLPLPVFGGQNVPGYQLTTSAPVRVRIPVWNNFKAIQFSESTIIDRRRGAELNGVIEFGVLPTETKDGRASFAYSP
ncbi:MAG: hypothetical protein P9L94_19395 [Candidatus Hinthialibacter antarcticus]|nr:hypothetical protein [Candidatus Hinthialibacter antarcticus]